MKIIAISDTHMKHEQIVVPDGDVLVHAGDALNGGSIVDFVRFLDWFKEFPHPHKIYVPGNHDRCLERHTNKCRKLCEDDGIILLIDQEVTIGQFKFYGSPWTPEFFNWAFMKKRGKALREVWNKIPKDTDVLITHGPAHRYLDLVTMYGSINKDRNVGCEELAKAIRRVKPMCHIFGHIHEQHGQLTPGNGTRFCNVAICNDRYYAVNEPTIIDL